MRRTIVLTLLAAWLAVPAAASPWTDWLGSQAQRHGQTEEAERYYKESDSALSHYNLGSLYLQQKKYEQAKAEFHKAAESSDSELAGKAYYNLGNSLYAEQKLKEALEAYKQALRHNALDDDARYNAAVVMEKLKQQDQEKKQDQKQNKQQDQEKKQDQKQNKQQDQEKKQDRKQNKQQDQEKKQDRKQNKQQDQEKKQDQKQNKQQDQEKNQQQEQEQQILSPEEARKREAQDLLRYFDQKERRETRQRARKAQRFYTKGAESW